MPRPQPHRIFLSSTYLDLADTRSQIKQWLSGIFGSELIIMETFGSDGDPPDNDLSVRINLRPVQENRLKEDLFVVSKALGISGVYPPYVQMLIDHIWSSSKKGKGKYTLKNYQAAGGMEGVIGGYLGRQMQYAQDPEGHVRAVLISLVRSYGVKAQNAMEEIVVDTGHSLSMQPSSPVSVDSLP